MTRDTIRQDFEKSNLSYRDINRKNITHLKKILSKKLKISDDGVLNMKLSASNKFKYNNKGYLISGYLFVDSVYFNKREAISFNTDGFIGFAGWASSLNSDPFLEAFYEWMTTLKN